MAVVAQLEVWATQTGSPTVAYAVAALAMTVPLAWRRPAPIGVLALVFVPLFAMKLAGRPVDSGYGGSLATGPGDGGGFVVRAVLPIPSSRRARRTSRSRRALFVSETTAKTHVRNVLAKLDLRDGVHAVVFAYESGLVRPGGP